MVRKRGGVRREGLIEKKQNTQANGMLCLEKGGGGGGGGGRHTHTCPKE